MAVDSLSYRFAGMGKERRNTINEYFKQIINLSVPNFQRYLLQTAHKGCHIFAGESEGKKEQEEWFEEMIPYLGEAVHHPKMP